jgi:hypothetical protein
MDTLLGIIRNLCPGLVKDAFQKSQPVPDLLRSRRAHLAARRSISTLDHTNSPQASVAAPKVARTRTVQRFIARPGSAW